MDGVAVTRDTTAGAARVERFPLALAVAGIVATGLGLATSALGVQWGASSPEPDALRSSWEYVNVAMVWAWLLVWPAMSLGGKRLGKGMLLWELAVLLVAAVPAMGVAAFLSGVTGKMIAMAAALQIACGMLAMGAMAWRRAIGAGIVGGSLAILAVALPVMGYLWAEFFAATAQGWRAFIPAVAASRVADAQMGGFYWWVVGSYALVGFGLWGTARREE